MAKHLMATLGVFPDPDTPHELAVYLDGTYWVGLERGLARALRDLLNALPEEEFEHVCIQDPLPWAWTWSSGRLDYDAPRQAHGPRHDGRPPGGRWSEFLPRSYFCPDASHYPPPLEKETPDA